MLPNFFIYLHELLFNIRNNDGTAAVVGTSYVACLERRYLLQTCWTDPSDQKKMTVAMTLLLIMTMTSHSHESLVLIPLLLT